MSARQEIALITGASDGIGKAFVLALQARCRGMILVGRSAAKLAAVTAELELLAGDALWVHCIATDLGSTLGQTQVLEAIRQRGPVTVLVNNAGFGQYETVADGDLDAQLAMINLHCAASLALCRGALPYMREAGRGQIINVASLGAFLPFPKVAVYSATKAFLLSFSQALAREEQGNGIGVQCLCPGYARTAIHGRDAMQGFDVGRIPEEAWSTVEEVVAASLAALADPAKVVVVPGDHNRRLASAALRSLAEQV